MYTSACCVYAVLSYGVVCGFAYGALMARAVLIRCACISSFTCSCCGLKVVRLLCEWLWVVILFGCVAACGGCMTRCLFRLRVA